ncbi:headcase protein [Thrips palmi]|uniref:Headcase protein n=1 Tax=Thrips palmi TaxID=161013 RepID=A0A6P8ZWN3_THRPL|nr:headcase protein [Thrips palmi]
MEDEGNHGNDETRCFILSTLAAHQLNRTACLLCGAAMAVFDRYPLVDGTFFLTPRKHSAACLATKVDGRTQYLSAVCMGCMENKKVTCRACAVPWDGTSLVLGTMYSYDIFAAMPCCPERYKCNSCKKPLLSAFQRLNYFSDYSQDVACPHCGVSDHHFIKSLTGSYHLTP